MSERQWWPTDWVDEICPPARSEPDGFLINADGHYYLGYALDATDATEHDKRYFSRRIAPGDIVKFVSCDRFGEIVVTIRPDGAFAADRPVPEIANSFVSLGKDETLADSLDEFVRIYRENGEIAGPARDEVRVAVAHWSADVPYKLTLSYEGNWPPKAGFTPVSDAEARQ